jgi:hypothetical protein
MLVNGTFISHEPRINAMALTNAQYAGAPIAITALVCLRIEEDTTQNSMAAIPVSPIV